MGRVALTPDQAEAAGFLHGRLVVTAGPGSGKTRVLVERIRNLLEIAHPFEIVAVTFTNKAADELEARLGVSLGYVGTLHGFAHSILSAFPDAEAAMGPRFGVLSELDRRDLVRACAKEVASPVPLGPTLEILARHAQSEAAPKSPIPPLGSREVYVEKTRQAYEARKARYRLEDFDGLIARARMILERNPLAAQQIRQRVRHLSVDEAQDLDRSQDALLELVAPEDGATTLAMGNRSIALVGDPLQAIYGWRGGDPEILAERGERAHARVFLGRNFRSVPEIVEATNRVADLSPEKPDGYVLEAVRKPRIQGEVVTVSTFDDDDQEAEAIARVLQRFEGQVLSYRDAAVLARTNGILERIAVRLDVLGVPYRRLGAVRNFLRDPAVRGAIAYLRLALNPADDLAFALALDTPSRPAVTAEAWRYLDARKRGRSYVRTALDVIGSPEDAPLGFPEELKDVLDRVATIVPEVDGSSSPFGWSGPVVDLLAWLQDRIMAQGFVGRVAALVQLEEILGDYVRGKRRGRGAATLRGFLWWATFGQPQDEIDPDEDAVTLSTVHLSKGLEWSVVFLPGWCEGILPSSQAVEADLQGDADRMGEELRLAFVAVSRAEDAVFVSTTRRVTVAGQGTFQVPADPSRFLAPLLPASPL